MANGQNNKECLGTVIFKAIMTAKRENNIKYLYPGLSIAFVLMKKSGANMSKAIHGNKIRTVK